MNTPTKHPDAAVNAESAARLVSDEMVRLADEAAIRHFAGLPDEQKVSDARFGCLRAALEAVAANLIERHATLQTQATHGEGEADNAWDRRELGASMEHAQPAPSPTAAPRGTRSELIEELKQLGFHLRMVENRLCDFECEIGDSDTCIRAAAALGEMGTK